MSDNANTKSSDSKGPEPVTPKIRSEYTALLYRQPAGAEVNSDYMWSTRESALHTAVVARQGDGQGVGTDRDAKFSARFIVDQAASRHFALLEDAMPTMHGLFTEEEVTLVLNTTCGPIWDWDPYMKVASMVGDHAGVGRLRDLDPDSSIRKLLEKLRKLSALQDAALVDFCERFWRLKNYSEEVTSKEIFESLGLQLIASS